MSDLAHPTTATESPWPSRRAGWYAVGVLLLAYTVAYVDRSILTIIVEPIQRDLHINDTQVGLLHGFAFVIFYVSLGVPLGLLADRANRKWLIVGSITVWSVMTSACGLASAFPQLFLARIGVGVGEAGLSPGSYSLISDYFAPKRRTAALGVYTIGIYLGSGFAILAGGVILSLIGTRPSVDVPIVGAVRAWQVVFFIIGLPGLLVALLALTVREPRRRLDADEGVKLDTAAQWAGVTARLRRHWKAYLAHAVGFAFLGVTYNVALLWARPCLTRRFGVEASHAAYIVGGVMLVCATAGIVSGSLIADRWQARGRQDATVRIAIVSACAVLPFIAAFGFLPTVTATAADLAFALYFGAFAFGAAPSALALMTPNRMRATTSAIYLLLVNLVGLTCGPTLVGVLTDYVFHDPKAVGASISIVGTGSTLIALAALVALRAPFTRAVADRHGGDANRDTARRA
jgi:MFS family permease